MTVEELLADTETLTSILTYHVLGETVTSGDIVGADAAEIPVETLSGEDLTVVVADDGTVGVADQTATVTMTDIELRMASSTSSTPYSSPIDVELDPTNIPQRQRAVPPCGPLIVLA